MITHSRVIVLVILVLIVLLTAWSRLRHVDENDFAPQRIRVDQHPVFQNG